MLLEKDLSVKAKLFFFAGPSGNAQNALQAQSYTA